MLLNNSSKAKPAFTGEHALVLTNSLNMSNRKFGGGGFMISDSFSIAKLLFFKKI